MRELAQERAIGIYKDDVKGFIEAINDFMEDYEHDVETTMVGGDSATNVTDDIFYDRERFRSEIAEQLQAKIKHHVYGKKRVATDYIKPKFNEASLYASLDESVSAMEQKVSTVDEDEEDFDREAYNRFKQELSERKRVKEEMLTGTLPRFKPYLRL